MDKILTLSNSISKTLLSKFFRTEISCSCMPHFLDIRYYSHIETAFKARCHEDSLQAGKSRWQVSYWVSLYCH